MDQAVIWEMLNEAAQATCPWWRKNEILDILCESILEMQASGRPARISGKDIARFLADLFMEAVKTKSEFMPSSLFPSFALACGERKNGKPYVKWSLMYH